jgi:hypothetical protein
VETRKTFQRKAKRIELGIIPDIRGFTSKLDLADQVVEHVKMQKTRGNKQLRAESNSCLVVLNYYTLFF